MGEEAVKENGPTNPANDAAGETQSDGAAGSRLTRRKSIRDQITGIGDLVLLEPLREDGLINNLRVRYGADEIYVSIS